MDCNGEAYDQTRQTARKTPAGKYPKKHLAQKLGKKSGAVFLGAANIDNSNAKPTTS